MKIFKDIMWVINRYISTFCFGYAMADLFSGDYKIAAWFLFGVSISFMVGYFAERWSN